MEEFFNLDTPIIFDFVIYFFIVLSYLIALAFLRDIFCISFGVKESKKTLFHDAVFRFNNYFKRLVEKGRTTFSNLINLK